MASVSVRQGKEVFASRPDFIFRLSLIVFYLLAVCHFRVSAFVSDFEYVVCFPGINPTPPQPFPPSEQSFGAVRVAGTKQQS